MLTLCLEYNEYSVHDFKEKKHPGVHGGPRSAFSHPVGIQSRQVPWTVWHEGWPVLLQSVWAACGDWCFPEVD